MDQNKTKEMLPTAPFALANVRQMPLQFEKAISDVPDGLKVSTLPPDIKLTSRSIRKALKRNAIVLIHHVNACLVDELVSVSRYYKIISQMAFNYQREHENAFFDIYPDLVILSDEEEQQIAAGTLVFDTNYKRQNYRKFAKRLAHDIYDYHEAKKMQTAALLNLMSFTRFNGNEVTKSIASQVRWTYINTNCVLYERFPSFIGAEAYQTQLMSVALGTSTYGADLISMPYQITDIYGNRGFHCQPIDSLISRIEKDYGVLPNFTGENLPNFDKLKELTDHMKRTIANYGQATPTYTAGKPSFTKFSPAMMKIENGGSYSAVGAAFTVAQAKMNVDGDIVQTENPAGLGLDGDQLTNRMWSAFKFWTNYLVTVHPEFMDPNSDKYEFCISQLKILEPSSKLEDLISKVRALPNIDIADLASRMSYKKSGQVTTANIVKWSPMDFTSTEAGYTFRGSTFADNYERLEVDSNNTADMINKSKAWPKLGPTMFFDKNKLSNKPLVANCVPMVGVDFPAHNDGSVGSEMLQTCTGKNAAFLDYCIANGIDPNSSNMEFVAVTDEFVKDFCKQDITKGIVFEECPDFVTVLSQPAIDCSDLLQCGFNVLVSADDPNPNAWEQYFCDPENYRKVDSHADIITTVIKSGANALGPCFNNQFGRAHLANEAYLTKLKHAMIFAGVGIFMSPLAALASSDVGYFVNGLQLVPKSGDVYGFPAAGMNSVDACFQGTGNFGVNLKEMVLSAGTASRTSGAKANTNLSQVISTIHGTVADDMNIQIWSISPEYGRILIAHDKFDLSGISTIIPSAGLATPAVSQFGNIPTIGLIKPLTGNIATEGSVDNDDAGWPTIGLTVKEMDLQFLFPAAQLLFFIGSITIPQLYVDPESGIFTSGEPYKIDMLSDYKWVFSTIAKQVAMFAGINATIPFWDSGIQAGSPSFNIASTHDIPENNIAAEPRVPRGVRTSGKNFANQHGGARPIRTESQQAMPHASMHGDSSDDKDGDKPTTGGKKFNKGFKRHHNRRDFKTDKNYKSPEVKFESNQSGISSESKLETANSNLDQSDAKSDKEFKKLNSDTAATAIKMI